MFKFKALLEAHANTICKMIGEEHGKIFHDAMVNFPAMVPMWMFPMAIVCGNCFVLKPSERNPSATLYIAQLLQEAGLPDADLLISKMTEAMKSLKVGAFSDNENDFGPLITRAHQEKVVGFINSAESQGADIVVDGRQATVNGYEGGFFVGGTLIDRVTAQMDSYQQEIFGPVLQVVRVDTMQAAMELINAHEYGNGTCIFTRDGEAARYFSDHIEVGMVGINVPLPVPVAYHSFGGWKRSLFGDLHAYGPDGVRFYTKRKTVTQRWPSAGLRESVSFAMPT
jgi:malonate-semialdehyde dehydrogenase (acetylating)/methylmalonate-semialdehyde dehydrogenase